MTQRSGPFDTGPGAALTQDDMLDGLGSMFSGDGVDTSSFGDTTLQVYGNNSGMQVLVRPGRAIVRGVQYRQTTTDVTVAIGANSSGSTRIDRVVLRNDRAFAGGGKIYPFVIAGTPGAAAPAIVRTDGGIWDVPLAQVTVASGTAGIVAGNVADDREYLPLKVRVIDSRITSPYSTTAKVLYDRNPAVQGLWVSNGSAWQQVDVIRRSNQTVATDPAMVGTPSFLKARRSGDVVNVSADLYLVGGQAGQIATLPSTYWPTDQIAQGDISPDGNSDGHWAIGTTGHVIIDPLPGSFFPHLYHVRFNACYVTS